MRAATESDLPPRRWAPGSLRAFAPALLLVVLAAGIGIAAPSFATFGTLAVTLSDTSVLFVLAAGMTFVIMLGGIDLSVQAVASFASVLVATLLPMLGVLAFPAAIVAGLLAGLASGYVHVRLRIPSFVATLATGGVMSGLALLASHGRTVTILEEGRAQADWITGAALWRVPNVILVGALVAVAGIVVQRYTRFGRYSVAIGSGEPAALASGIRVEANKIIAFGLSGALAALAGVMLAARLSSGSPNLANQLLLPTIAAVVVGGTAITGGVGGVGRTVVGALIVSTVQIGMTFLGVNIFAQQIVFGVALICAVCVTIDRGKMPIVK
jgi:ribose transport system permease protein